MGFDTLLENQLGHWPKFQQLHIHSISGVEVELILTLYTAVSGIRAEFKKLPYLGMKFAIGQLPEVAHILFLPRGVSEIRADFKNCHIWAWNLLIAQSSRSYTHTLFLPQGGRNWTYFRYTSSGFRYMGQFSKFPYLSMKLNWPLAKVHI